MTEYAANLQMFNQEFVKCLENLKKKRDQIKREIDDESVRKQQIEKEIEKLRLELQKLSKNLLQCNKNFQSYECTIQELEAGYKKIFESAEILLNVVKRELAEIDSNSD